MPLQLQSSLIFSQIQIVESCIGRCGRISAERWIVILPLKQILVIVAKYQLLGTPLMGEASQSHKNRNKSHIILHMLGGFVTEECIDDKGCAEDPIEVEYLVAIGHVESLECFVGEFLGVVVVFESWGFTVPSGECC